MVAKWWFLFTLLLFLHLFIGFLRNSFLFSPCIFELCNNMDSCVFFLIQWIIILYCHNLFWCSNCPRFESSFKAAFCTLPHHHHLLQTSSVFLALWGITGSSSPRTFSHPALVSAISPKSPSSVQWRMIFRIQDLVTGHAHSCWCATTPRANSGINLKDTWVHTVLYLFL